MLQESDGVLAKAMLAAITNLQIHTGSATTDMYVTPVKYQTGVLIGMGLPGKIQGT